MRKGEVTRERLLATAELAVLDKGFAATSIDELIAHVGITKSGFFYHFRDKNELALAVLDRYIVMDDAQVCEVFSRATELSDDPLQRFLIAMKLYAELMDGLTSIPSGCVAASLAYQDSQVDRRVRDRMKEAALGWRKNFRAMLDDIAATYPQRDPIDLDVVADFCGSAMQGAIVIAKMQQNPRIMGQQVMALRSYIKLLFQPGLH